MLIFASPMFPPTGNPYRSVDIIPFIRLITKGSIYPKTLSIIAIGLSSLYDSTAFFLLYYYFIDGVYEYCLCLWIFYYGSVGCYGIV